MTNALIKSSCFVIALISFSFAAAAPAGERKCHRRGLIPAPPSRPASARAVLESVRARRAAELAETSIAALSAFPSSHDNSAGLPPVGDQLEQNSCVSWVVGYYMKSYHEARERGWSLADSAHRFSPAFLYNQVQFFDDGSTFEDNLDVVMNHGCASLVAMPYDDTDYRTWPTAEAYRQGIPFRGETYDYLGDGKTPDVFDAIKALISSGELVTVGFPVYQPDAVTPGRFDDLWAGDYEYDMPPASDSFNGGYHAVTIVGYDESKFEGNGGYKIVNSWDTDWGNGGFAWLSERYLATYSSDIYYMTDRIGYEPTAFLRWKVSHTFWGWDYDNVSVTVGVGPTGAPLWSRVIIAEIEPDSLTIDMWYDITEAAAHLPPDWNNRWWLKVTDDSADDIGTVHTFEIEAAGSVESAEVVLPVATGFLSNTVYFYIPAGEAASTDYYVDAGGDDANGGLTPATPKRTVQAVIDRYTLKAGDTVWIDGGTYDLNSDITLNYLDKGEEGSPIRFVGAVAPNGDPATVLNRAGTSGRCFYFHDGNRFVQLENLWLKGGRNGVYCDGSWAYDQGEMSLRNVRISGTSGYACYLDEAQGVVLSRCRLHGFGGSSGLYVGMSTADLDHCVIHSASGRTAVALDSSSYAYDSNAYLTVTNSILTASGSGKRCVSLGAYSSVSEASYNDLFATGGATIGFAPDGTNISVDPLFADPANDDYHLKSRYGRWDPSANDGAGGWVFDAVTSPCIDLGDPADDCSNEPPPNGGRINMGAYGNTDRAARSGPWWNIPGDINGDCVVNVLDMLFVRNTFLEDKTTADNWRADVDSDGQIDVIDMLIVRDNLKEECE
ncbi:MAG: hypothetical protein HQ592_15935 [Planctomycetes bacterium]|nr:hypothetical protein [Planctomycetota bacterium]